MVDHDLPGLMLILIALSVNLLGDWFAGRTEPQTALGASMNLLEVRNLVVEFPTRHGTPCSGRYLVQHRTGKPGIVGESGAGKSLNGSSHHWLARAARANCERADPLEGQRSTIALGEQLRRIRGRQIGAIFQTR